MKNKKVLTTVGLFSSIAVGLLINSNSASSQFLNCEHGQQCQEECAETVLGVCIKHRVRCSCVTFPKVTRGTGIARISLPTNIPSQDTGWSCGPNSATRVLRHYGHDVTYNTLKLIAIRMQNIPEGQNAGIAPHELRNIIQRYEGDNVALERQSSFGKLLDLLIDGKPVIALLRVGSIDSCGTDSTLGRILTGGICGATWPAMHWIVVTGFDEHNSRIYYTDTDGGEYYYSYREFNDKWDWGIGEGLAKETMYANGVYPRTIVWVNRERDRQSTGLSTTFAPDEVLPPTQPVCFTVSSQQGWQYFNLPRSFSRISSIEGSWSVDDRAYSPVGASGHTGEAADRLAPYNQYKYNQDYPFGALFVDIPNYGYIWVQNPQQLPQIINSTAMRINDADNALGDNAGSLRVCFGD
jgi:hypothetical protein